MEMEILQTIDKKYGFNRTQFLKLSGIRIIQYIFMALNLATALFYLIYFILGKSSIIGNLFGVFAILIIAADIVYCAFSKSKLSIYMMVCFGLGILFNHLGLLNLSASSPDSTNVLAVLPMIFIPLLFIVMQIFEIGMPNLGNKLEKTDKLLKVAFKIVAPIALFVFCLLAYDSIYNYGYSDHEYTTSRAALMFAFEAFIILVGLIKVYFIENDTRIIEKFKKHGIHMMLCSIIGIFTISAFIAPFAMIPKNIKDAKNEYISAFGDNVFDKNSTINAKNKNLFRTSAFNFGDKFVGIRTKNYMVEKDVLYYTNTATGLTLHYDVYLPTVPNAHKSVLVYMHGRGGDKGNSNEKSKYFAGQGYIVYDIQVGDSYEANTNYPKEQEPTYQYMMENIYEFFTFATKNNDYGANWQSVFLMGSSMGGGLTLALTFEENKFEEVGVKIKGILPIYPPENETLTVEQIKTNALPCLILMGSHDGAVNPNGVKNLKYLYNEAGFKNIAIVWVDYAAHGCDVIFADRANQIFIYFAERFMAQMR